MAQKLGEILKGLGLVDEAGLQSALDRKARLGGGRIGEHLLAVGAISEEGLLRGLARQRRVPFADATVFANLDERLKRLVPRSKAFHYLVVPVRYLDGQLVLATCEVQNLERVRELIDALGHKVRLVLAPRPPVEEAIARLYSFDANAFSGRSEVPSPARLKPRRRKREEPAIAVEPPVDERTAPQPRMATSIEQVKIARELEGELDPQTGVFQLTREALAEAQGSVLPDDDDGELDTQVRRQSAARQKALHEADEDAATVLDTDMGARIRAELHGEGGTTGDSDLWATLSTGHLPLRLPSSAKVAPPVAPVSDTKPRDPPAPNLPRAQQDLAPLTPGWSALATDFEDETQPPEPDAVSLVQAPPLRSLAVDLDNDAIRPPLDVHRARTLPPGEVDAVPAAFASVPGRRGAVGHDAQPTGEVFGNYRLLRKIKTGGMAVVFEAVTRGIEGVVRRVAIKRILPNLTDSDEFVAMFIDEAKITVQLNHAAIGQVYELGRVGDDYFIAMEYIHGRDLNAIFTDAYERGTTVPIPIAAHVVQQVCEGLDYAHRKADLNGNSLGIVHRDVSPANVLCSFEGMVKIIDFGIAKAVSKVSLTRPGLIKGKISYMSPEQMRGQPIDHRSDIFAIGIVLYELLAGKRLFAGNSDVETIRNVLKGEVPPLRSVRPEIPEDLASAVHKALERDPSRRFAWAVEFSHELQRVMLRNNFTNVRSELTAYMDARFGGQPASEENKP
ncbi:MAG: protein kinase [Pseudomonadota bacterium]